MCSVRVEMCTCRGTCKGTRDFYCTDRTNEMNRLFIASTRRVLKTMPIGFQLVQLTPTSADFAYECFSLYVKKEKNYNHEIPVK